MKLSQLAAESAARLKDLRDHEGPKADAQCWVSAKEADGEYMERDVESVQLNQLKHLNGWFFEIKTEKDEE